MPVLLLHGVAIQSKDLQMPLKANRKHANQTDRLKWQTIEDVSTPLFAMNFRTYTWERSLGSRICCAEAENPGPELLGPSTSQPKSRDRPLGPRPLSNPRERRATALRPLSTGIQRFLPSVRGDHRLPLATESQGRPHRLQEEVPRRLGAELLGIVLGQLVEPGFHHRPGLSVSMAATVEPLVETQAAP